jgi:hypothetical protein
LSGGSDGLEWKEIKKEILNHLENISDDINEI